MAKSLAYVHPESARVRSEVLTRLDPRSINSMNIGELGRLKEALGYGADPQKWEVPAEWMPKGRGQRHSERVLTIAKMSSSEFNSDAPALQAAWTDIIRMALIRSLVPARIGGIATASTVMNEIKLAARVAQALIRDKRWKGTLWSSVTADVGLSTLKKHGWRMLRSTLHHLYQTGYIAESFKAAERRNGASPEIDRKGRKAPTLDPDDERSWQALPDAFVAGCGWRVAWLIRNLGPTLLSALEAVANLGQPPMNRKGRAHVGRGFTELQRDRRDDVVRQWDWSLPEAVPFGLRIARRVNPGRSLRDGPELSEFSWPPQTFHEILLLTNLLQTAHSFVMMLSAGPRATEVLSYEEDCIEESDGSQPRIKGRTYKLEKAEAGKERDFPAPAFVLLAARQQQRLARAIKALAADGEERSFGTHLWVQVTTIGASKQGTALKDLNYSLASMVKTLDLGHLLDDENPSCHTHRFRKTLARLVALALVNAQMILMDCFGHEDPEMTLIRYILSDRRIHADVIRVQKELVIMLAEDSITAADELGGVAGGRVRHERDLALTRLGKDELDPQDIRELAETLTLDGRSWVVVGPGIICALPQGSSGPCSRRQGGRNPAYCKSECDHQILTAFNKTETDDSIAFMVEQLGIATSEENSLMIAQWRGQITAWLYRWRDVYEKWSTHELISSWASSWGTKRGTHEQPN